MQITFAGTIIAQERDFFGFDAVQGFVPKGKGTTQWKELLRAADDTPMARGNRKRTMSGKIYPPPAPSLAVAMQLRGTQYNNLPDVGTLIIQVGNLLTTFANAVLDAHDPFEVEGIAVGFSLSFSVGIGTPSTLPAGAVVPGVPSPTPSSPSVPVTDAGTVEVTDAGSPITLNPSTSSTVAVTDANAAEVTNAGTPITLNP